MAGPYVLSNSKSEGFWIISGKGFLGGSAPKLLDSLLDSASDIGRFCDTINIRIKFKFRLAFIGSSQCAIEGMGHTLKTPHAVPACW